MGFFGGGGGTTPVNMVGASTGTAGTAGYVPAPAAGKNTRYLSSDATFGEVPFYPKRKDNSANWKSSSLTAVAGATGSANPAARGRIFGIGFFPDDGDITTLGFRVVTAPVAAVNVHVGLWECGEDGLPSTYITGGTVSSGTSGNTDISVSVGTTSVKRGYHFYAVTYSTGAGSCSGWAGASGTITGGVYGRQANVQGTGLNPSYTATAYDQTTHESFAASAANVPVVAFKYL